jgi:hypothetical protein
VDDQERSRSEQTAYARVSEALRGSGESLAVRDRQSASSKSKPGALPGFAFWASSFQILSMPERGSRGREAFPGFSPPARR